MSPSATAEGLIRRRCVARSTQRAIAEAWRGKGIGAYCLEQAMAFAPSIKVHTLLGFIFGHNAPSLGLFRKYGFDTWAHFPRVANLDGIERDLIILGKRVA